jgi:hypothetical protein
MSRGLRTSTVLRATVAAPVHVRIFAQSLLCEYPHIHRRLARGLRTSARGWLGQADQDIQAQVFLAEVLDLLALHDFDAAVTGRESVAVFGDPGRGDEYALGSSRN